MGKKKKWSNQQLVGIVNCSHGKQCFGGISLSNHNQTGRGWILRQAIVVVPQWFKSNKVVGRDFQESIYSTDLTGKL